MCTVLNIYEECADLREGAERVLWRDGRGIAQCGVAHLRALGTASKETSVKLVHVMTF